MNITVVRGSMKIPVLDLPAMPAKGDIIFVGEARYTVDRVEYEIVARPPTESGFDYKAVFVVVTPEVKKE